MPIISSPGLSDLVTCRPIASCITFAQNESTTSTLTSASSSAVRTSPIASATFRSLSEALPESFLYRP
jgi:hypothetical protein